MFSKKVKSSAQLFHLFRRANLSRCTFRNYSTGIEKSTPEQFIETMKKAGIRRGYIVYDETTQKMRASHPIFEELGEYFIKDKRDFYAHEAMFFEIGKKSNLLFSAFLHKTVRGQGQGGVRLWPYNSIEDYVRDGLRLSLGMGRKNALAGLWWGGGKGVIARDPKLDMKNEDNRTLVFNEYGDFVTSLRGCYYGAEDVGLTPADTARMFHRSRFITCIPKEIGGSGNPSSSTAKGVVCAMEGVLDFLGKGTLEGKRIAMQGAGNVASFMIEHLLQRNVKSIIATDISKDAIEAAQKRFANYKNVQLRLVEPGDNSVLFEDADIIAPNALGGILNPTTIPQIKSKIVCGAANNQLLDPVRDDALLKESGITYVPDYLCNRMGIVNCANESYGYVTGDPAIERHFSRDWENSVFVITKRVLQLAKDKNIPTGLAANQLADELAKIEHPIFGHRSKFIIESLIKDGWANEN